jgi:hypothetical protein
MILDHVIETHDLTKRPLHLASVSSGRLCLAASLQARRCV